MNNQSRKSFGYKYKTPKNAYNRSFEKGYTKFTEAEEERIDFRFIVPWQMH
jgi:hypothetical protein